LAGRRCDRPLHPRDIEIRATRRRYHGAAASTRRRHRANRTRRNLAEAEEATDYAGRAGDSRRNDELARAGFTAKDRQARVSENYREDFDDLDRFRDRAAAYAEAHERYPTEGTHFDNPKFMFQFKVLLIWTELGGELRISRHGKYGTVQGPLARFFRAVTVPVMGALAPSPESLPDIIRRQSRFLAFEATPFGQSVMDDMHREIHQLR
jgi:hypothetical protein